MTGKKLIVVRGAGDIATGTIQKLHRAGFLVIATESAQPSAIRRRVSLCEAVYEKSQTVEDIIAVRADTLEEAYEILSQNRVAVMIDPSCALLGEVRPLAVIDAILAKKNMGTTRDMAPITIALGPGFTADQDVDAVIETMRGHNLGRLLFQGSAMPNTGIPGIIEGYGRERVIYSPCAGRVVTKKEIGDMVEKGEALATVEGQPVPASIGGILRGLIRDGFTVSAGFKMADIDPREAERENCFTISDKARCIGGTALEAVLLLSHSRNLI